MNPEKRISEVFNESLDLRKKNSKDVQMKEVVLDIVNEMVRAVEEGNKILFCGNGGSAADAQHLAAELSGKFYLDRDPVHAEALHVNSSYLTATANDFGYEVVFERLVKAKGKPRDILIGISTSGSSENVLRALKMGRELGMITIGFCGGNSEKMEYYCNHVLNIPSENTPRIQEEHMFLGHLICELAEAKLFG